MDWPDFVLYQLSYSRCLATLVGRIRTCDCDVFQIGSRFVYGLRRSYGPLPAGKATVQFEFAYDGPGLGKGGTGTILVNGKKVVEGKFHRTQSGVFSADGGADVGPDGETPVSDDYQEGDIKFTREIKKVVIEVGTVKRADKN